MSLIDSGDKEKKTRRNEITAFMVGDKVFTVLGSDHALNRLHKRRVNPYHVASTILALGEKLLHYNNSKKQIIIPDRSKHISTIFCVENYTIVLITVLDKSNPIVKPGTVIETFMGDEQIEQSEGYSRVSY